MDSDIKNILLVEDNPADACLIREVFKELSINHKIYWVQDGNEAMSFLRKKGRYNDVPEPSLILLDLNLPGKNGYEVLQEIKSDNSLRLIPVLILSTSESSVDKAYDYFANSYLTKPIDFDSYLNMFKAIDNFWFKCAKLPEPV